MEGVSKNYEVPERYEVQTPRTQPRYHWRAVGAGETDLTMAKGRAVQVASEGQHVRIYDTFLKKVVASYAGRPAGS